MNNPGGGKGGAECADFLPLMGYNWPKLEGGKTSGFLIIVS